MTATILENDLDNDLFTVLDFDVEIPCEAEDGCPNTPDYRVTTKCCGISLLICEDCLFDFMEYHAASMKNGMKSRCQECRHLFPNGEFPLIVTAIKA